LKKLSDILYKVNIEKVIGNTEVIFQNVHFDSREVSLNDVFIAIDGSDTDGHQFIKSAVDKGALAVICEKLPEIKVNGVNYIQVDNTRLALAQIADNYHDQPSRQLKLVGVTGTNGKTTVCTLLHQLFTNAGYKTGLISTVAVKIGNRDIATQLTTPDSLTINGYLAQMVDEGISHVFMEVSSHGIDQGRTHGLDFDIAAFTNLSQDHLDYHGTFANYRDAKKKFFDQMPKRKIALTNIDDKNGEYMLQNCQAKKITYACQRSTDHRTRIIANTISGLVLEMDDNEVHTQLIGKFNAYNLTLVKAIAVELGMERNKVIRLTSGLKPVAGRFQLHVSKDDHITAIIDYAHTPDALKNVLQTINSIRKADQELITLIGCGGNRDRTKRPKMAGIAVEHSDKVIFTSDNPRDEDPQAILDEMMAQLSKEERNKTMAIVNRGEAIDEASEMVRQNGIILIAGKGHENYQIIKGERMLFDDLEEVKEKLNKNNR
jgi:UDP-N-acetylmuramoyl-L-alanyl-D-glutamate--2,6-diaminopimelate ligase